MCAAVQSQRGDNAKSSSPRSGCTMKLQKSQPAETAQLVHFFCLVGPTEKYGCTIPRKNARPRNAQKSWQHFEHLRARTVAGRYEEEALQKARVGTNCPHVQRWIIRMHIIMTAANCSPAVASRRAKYDGATSGFQRSWMHRHTMLPRAFTNAPRTQCRHGKRT